MDWYKKASLSDQLKEELKKAHPSLLANKFFLYGVDPESYPEGGVEKDRLKGDEWRKAFEWEKIGWEWYKKHTDPEQYEIEMAKRKESERKEREARDRHMSGIEKENNMRRWREERQTPQSDVVDYFNNPYRPRILE